MVFASVGPHGTDSRVRPERTPCRTRLPHAGHLVYPRAGPPLGGVPLPSDYSHQSRWHVPSNSRLRRTGRYRGSKVVYPASSNGVLLQTTVQIGRASCRERVEIYVVLRLLTE